MLKKLEIALLVLFVCTVVAVSGCMSSSVKVVVNYPGSWNGTITDSSGTRTIEGTGDKTIDLGGIIGSLKVQVQKKDTSSDTLTASIMRDDKNVTSLSTFAPNGDVTLSIYLTA